MSDGHVHGVQSRVLSLKVRAQGDQWTALFMGTEFSPFEFCGTAIFGCRAGMDGFRARVNVFFQGVADDGGLAVGTCGRQTWT